VTLILIWIYHSLLRSNNRGVKVNYPFDYIRLFNRTLY
jgi:hypothetical protein